MITANYRQDYAGEFVILQTRVVNGKKQQEREWVENPIINQHISGRAAVIGSRDDWEQFEYPRLQRHRGGLLGKKKLQTYGTGAVWKDIGLDFYVGLDRSVLADLKSTGYQEKSVVYTSGKLCIENPGEFFLIPYHSAVDQIAAAVYLAAFDGHKEIFLLGINRETVSLSKHWKDQLTAVFSAYTTTRFCLVGNANNMHESWRKCRNVDTMTYREFISYCDV